METRESTVHNTHPTSLDHRPQPADFTTSFVILSTPAMYLAWVHSTTSCNLPLRNTWSEQDESQLSKGGDMVYQSWFYGLGLWISIYKEFSIFSCFFLMCMKGRFMKSGAGRSLRGAHLETDFERNKVMPSEWGIPKIRACQRQGQAKGCLFQEHLTSRALTSKRWHRINFIHLFCMIPGRYIHFLLLRLDRYDGKKRKNDMIFKTPDLFWRKSFAW